MNGRKLHVSNSVQKTRKATLCRFAPAAFFGLLSLPVFAQDGLISINLVDIGQGSGLSQAAADLGVGGYELADGTWTSFHQWYHTDWPEVHVEFMTQMSDDFGVLWGLGTGERGEKYTIDPSMRVGFIAQAHPTQNSVLALTVNTILGGSLAEHPCEADYGSIGGVQAVHCRLAASHLPPAETLQYLAFADPTRLRISLNFRASF